MRRMLLYSEIHCSWKSYSGQEMKSDDGDNDDDGSSASDDDYKEIMIWYEHTTRVRMPGS